MEDLIEQAIETWRINNRVNLYLLDAIPPEALSSVLPSGRTRTVARMFVHIHHVRMQLLDVSAPELMGGLAKLAKNDAAGHGANDDASTNTSGRFSTIGRHSCRIDDLIDQYQKRFT